jgi:predicted nucleic acid-binding protein
VAEYVTDTHSLLWYFARPKLLGPGAAAAFAQVAAGEAGLIVPVIVLAELIFALESKPLSADWDLVMSHLQASPNVTIADWTLARTLDLRHLRAIPEMHDRLIAAEALARGATLITRDQAITASGLVPVVW